MTNYRTIEAVEDGSGANGTVSNPLWTTTSAVAVGATGPMSGAGFTNAVGGIVRATTTNTQSGVAYGFVTDGTASILDTRGDMIIRGAYGAVGASVENGGLNLSVLNSGRIDVVAAAGASGLLLGRGGNLNNTGLISVEGSGSALGVYGRSSIRDRSWSTTARARASDCRSLRTTSRSPTAG